MTRLQRFVVVSVIAGLAACIGQEDPDYSGDPLAVIHGTVRSSVPVTGPLEITLWWIPSRGPVDQPEGPTVGQRVAVFSEFPGQFTLTLFEPPPADSFRTRPDPESGWPESSYAMIVAAPPGVAKEDLLSPGTIFGTSTDQIWYLYDDILEGTGAAKVLGGPFAAGYHVTRCRSASPFESPCYHPAPDDLDTVIELELAVR